jgi:hypothetical protein
MMNGHSQLALQDATFNADAPHYSTRLENQVTEHLRAPLSMRTRRIVRMLPSPSPRPLPRGEGEPWAPRK